MVNAATQLVTPILKRMRTISMNGALSPAHKKMELDEIGLKCEGVLSRLTTPGYDSKLEILRIRESSEEDQKRWLYHLASNIHALAPLTLKNDDQAYSFTIQCINMPWKLESGDGIRQAYSSFLFSLVTAHIEYLKLIIKRLFQLCTRELKDEEQMDLYIEPHKLEGPEIKVLECVLDTLCTVLTKIPTSSRFITDEARKSRPYFKKHPHTQVIYNSCLLLLCQRLPALRSELFTIVMNGLLKLGVQCDESALEDEDEDGSAMDIEEDAARKFETQLKFLTMDKLLETVILYVHCIVHGKELRLDREAMFAMLKEVGCRPASVKASMTGVILGCECERTKHDNVAVRRLYEQLVSFFTEFMVKTHSSEYTQFVVFHFLSMRPGFAVRFLDLLTDTFKTVSNPADVRKNAIAYMGSLLVRGKFVTFKLVQTFVTAITEWCQKYVNSHKNALNNFTNPQVHQVFYCACQTLFYIITFRHRDFTKNRESIEFMHKLSIGNLIYSGLNPLAVCSPAIVENFAAIALRYEIVVCCQVIERNKRNTIPVAHKKEVFTMTGNAVDVNFPFDPLPPVFKSSNYYIKPSFQEFEGLPEEITPRPVAPIESDEDIDDFLDLSSSLTNAGVPMFLDA